MRVRGKGTRNIFQGRRLQGPKLKFLRERASHHLQGQRLKFPRERAPRCLQGQRLRSPWEERDPPAQSDKKQCGRRRGPSFRKLAHCARQYDIRTIACPLILTSPAPVPRILHKVLINDATAEVHCVMTARSLSAHSSPRTPAFKPQAASALLSLSGQFD